MGEKSVFDSLKDRIQKNIKGTHVAVMSESEIAKPSEWVKTPAMDLNRILSGSIYRGIPNRHLIGIVGPEHTFKSSFMVLCMADAQKQGYSPVIIDTEGGAGNEFCTRWGLDTTNTLYIYSPWVDDVRSILAQIKEEGKKKFIIGIDSAGGLDRYKTYEDAAKGDPKADQGLLQKNIRSMLKLLLNICIEQETIGIVTGHLYSQPGHMPMPDQVGGGKAMRMFPTILINLKRKPIKDSDKNVTGTEITASTLKNRLYPPFQESVICIDYKTGIDPYAGLFDLMLAANLIEKSGNTYSARGENLGVGIENADAAIRKWSLFPDILKELDEWLKTTGYSSVNSNLKEVEEMMKMEIIGEQEDDIEEEIKANGRKGKRQLIRK